MSAIPSKAHNRIIDGLKKFQSIVQSAKTRDVNESDTVIIVTDMLSYIFGFDKYSEITSEYTIRGTYCDLATKIGNKTQYLIEVKAIGLELKDNYVKQAIDYAANLGIDWVVLTNGNHWRIFKVGFGKPITQEIVCDFEFLSLSHKKTGDIETLYLLTKEGWIKSHIEDYHAQKQVLSKFFIASLLLSDSVINAVKKELRKISSEVRVSNEQILEVIQQEVLKREVTEGEKVEDAKKAISRAFNKAQRLKKLVEEDDKQVPGSNAGTVTEKKVE
jgi:hypothetical protein